MYIEDRLYSEGGEEILYSVVLDETEMRLYSGFMESMRGYMDKAGGFIKNNFEGAKNLYNKVPGSMKKIAGAGGSFGLGTLAGSAYQKRVNKAAAASRNKMIGLGVAGLGALGVGMGLLNKKDK